MLILRKKKKIFFHFVLTIFCSVYAVICANTHGTIYFAKDPRTGVYKNACIFAHKTQIILVHVNYNI